MTAAQAGYDRPMFGLIGGPLVPSTTRPTKLRRKNRPSSATNLEPRWPVQRTAPLVSVRGTIP